MYRLEEGDSSLADVTPTAEDRTRFFTFEWESTIFSWVKIINQTSGFVTSALFLCLIVDFSDLPAYTYTVLQLFIWRMVRD